MGPIVPTKPGAPFCPLLPGGPAGPSGPWQAATNTIVDKTVPRKVVLMGPPDGRSRCPSLQENFLGFLPCGLAIAKSVGSTLDPRNVLPDHADAAPRPFCGAFRLVSHRFMPTESEGRSQAVTRRHPAVTAP